MFAYCLTAFVETLSDCFFFATRGRSPSRATYWDNLLDQTGAPITLVQVTSVDIVCDQFKYWVMFMVSLMLTLSPLAAFRSPAF